MGRPIRTDYEGGWYHVMNRGAGRQTVFTTRADGLEFERLLGESHERFGVEVHAYCLMSNHYHLLLHCPTGNLSDYMHHVGAVYTRHANERMGRDGPLFRGRFHSLLVDNPAYLLQVVRYIHRNPLDMPSVRSLSGYRWSSHAIYLGERERPAWIRTAHVTNMFDSDTAAFSEYVGGPTRPTKIPWTPEQLRELIDMVVDEQHDPSTASRHWHSRTVAVALLERIDGPARDAFEQLLVFPNNKARRAAQKRAQLRIDEVPELDLVIDRVHDLVA